MFLELYTQFCGLSCFSKAAVYGLGVCAEFGGSVFKPLVGGMEYLLPLVVLGVYMLWS